MALPSTEALDAVLQQAISERVFPGAAYAVGDRSRLLTGAVGFLTYEPTSPRATSKTVYDLASLTKVLGTTLSALRLEREGKLNLDDPAQKWLGKNILSNVSVRSLLTHTSGLPPYLHEMTEGSDCHPDILQIICELPLSPDVTHGPVYSCLGFIVLRHVLEAAADAPMAEIVRETIGSDICFTPDQSLAIAPTVEAEEWRIRRDPLLAGKLLVGVVHDPLAYLQGGISGNAGLFGSADSIACVLQELMQSPLQWEQAKRWGTRQRPYPHRGLGWDVRDPDGGTASSHASPETFGHLGYTGTSIWIDPVMERFAVLLSNRVHPVDKPGKMNRVRAEFYAAAFLDQNNGKVECSQ